MEVNIIKIVEQKNKSRTGFYYDIRGKDDTGKSRRSYLKLNLYTKEQAEAYARTGWSYAKGSKEGKQYSKKTNETSKKMYNEMLAKETKAAEQEAFTGELEPDSLGIIAEKTRNNILDSEHEGTEAEYIESEKRIKLWIKRRYNDFESYNNERIETILKDNIANSKRRTKGADNYRQVFINDIIAQIRAGNI